MFNPQDSRISYYLGVDLKVTKERPESAKIQFLVTFSPGEAFLLTVGAFLLTIELLCLQSFEVLVRHTFPL